MEYNKNFSSYVTSQQVNLVLLASSLQVLESFFPHPLPFVRLGLANVVSLLAILRYSFSAAVRISVLRTILSSLYLGTFLSPTFILSFFGAVVSTVVMWSICKISECTFLKFSYLSINIFGAVSHNITQLCIIYLLLIKQKNVFLLTPILIVSGLITGWISSVVVCSTVKKMGGYVDKYNECVVDKTSNEEVKNVKIALIICLIFLLVFVLLSKKVVVELVIMIAFGIILALKEKGTKLLFNNLKRVIWLMFFSFFIPLVSITGGKVFFKFGSINLTYTGFITATIYTLRLLNIVFITSFISVQFNKFELVRIFSKIMFFDKLTSEMLAASFYCLPKFIDKLKSKIVVKKHRRIKEIVDTITDIFVEFL